mmetsp:Transcript_3637/g.11309  ORF Transcript_3637/g.11309 Transcript_3637/m.11309 type:complete len:320 (-) Transcript_3637:926-1885(-)
MPHATIVGWFLRSEVDRGELDDHLQATITQRDQLWRTGHLKRKIRFRLDNHTIFFPLFVGITIIIIGCLEFVAVIPIPCLGSGVFDLVVGEHTLEEWHELTKDLSDRVVERCMDLGMKVVDVGDDTYVTVRIDQEVSGKPLVLLTREFVWCVPARVSYFGSFTFWDRFTSSQKLIPRKPMTSRKSTSHTVHHREERWMHQIEHLLIGSRMPVLCVFGDVFESHHLGGEIALEALLHHHPEYAAHLQVADLELSKERQLLEDVENHARGDRRNPRRGWIVKRERLVEPLAQDDGIGHLARPIGLAADRATQLQHAQLDKR